MREKNCLGQISEELRERREKVRKEKKRDTSALFLKRKVQAYFFKIPLIAI